MFIEMEPLRLSELEQRVYGDLFNQCDVENTGKVTGLGAGNLFITSGLSQEVLNQITDVCGAKRVGHFGRYQFYIALKLIAAAQVGYPVMMDTLSSGHELPLPVFGVQSSNQVDSRRMKHYAALDEESVLNERKQSLGNSQIQPPPKHARSHRNNIQGHDGPAVSGDAVNSPGHSPAASPSNVSEYIKQPNVGPAVLPNQHHSGAIIQSHISQMNLGAGSVHVPSGNLHPSVGPGHVSTNQMQAGTSHMSGHSYQLSTSSSNTSSNQTGPGSSDGSPTFDSKNDTEKDWASFDNQDNQGLISNEPKEWAHFTDSSSKHDTSSISSEAESVEDVWSITDEQREYYINQFKTMQPDVRGVISGAVAKDFFEKSKLPVAELSKIWQLSDVNRDGALSLEEFCTAMHLVVLRRNEIDLPEHLPPALVPYAPLNPEEPFAADLPPGSTLRKISPTPSSPSQQPPSQWNTYGQESPTSSCVSSPGSKPTPVNFDYTPITADPINGEFMHEESKIVHPVALRMSPDGITMTLEADGNSPDDDVLSHAAIQALPTFIAGPIHGRPRPTPKKSQSVPGPVIEQPVPHPRILPPPSSQDHNAGGDRPVTLPVSSVAPQPPPRPRSGHSRSSSLDNQLIDFSDNLPERLNQSLPPPAVPPRSGQRECVTFSDGDFGSSTQDAKNSSTPPTYLNDRPSSRPEVENFASTPAKFRHISCEQKDLRELIRTQRLRNMALNRVNSELNEELQEMMEQRIALEIQYEHLRPFHS